MNPKLKARMEEAAIVSCEVVPRDELIELLIKALKKANQDTRRLLDFYNNFESMKGGEG